MNMPTSAMNQSYSGHSNKTGEEQQKQKGSCLLLTIQSQHLLVARAIVAEVIKYSCLNFTKDRKTGLTFFEWRGNQVPFISNMMPEDDSAAPKEDDAKVIIFHGLKNNQLLPFYGFTVTHNPQLLHVSDEDMEEIHSPALHPSELMRVRVNNTEAFIPKVDYFESQILEHLE